MGGGGGALRIYMGGPVKVKPRFGDLGKKKTISLHGRPNIVVKLADSQGNLYTMGLRTWIWGSLALGVGYFE